MIGLDEVITSITKFGTTCRGLADKGCKDLLVIRLTKQRSISEDDVIKSTT